MDIQSIITIAGGIATLGTAVTVIQKVFKNLQKAREERNAIILHAAKEEISRARVALESRIKDIESDLANLKVALNKDLDYAKESNNEAIKVLGEKVDETRRELREAHTQILQLLTRMLDDKD
jgi:hypothetical protein